jgi:broad specificity phosphatase PhoE
MARLVLVRHAEPAASWGDHLDPGLSAVGERQAEEVARRLERRGPVPIVSSPLLRARETAAPLERRWAAEATVLAAVGEIPTPRSLSQPRVDWLRAVLAGRWSEVEDAARRWRAELLDTLRAVDDPTVVFTHFVAINVVVGVATGDDRVWSCSPAHASVTDIEVDGTTLEVVSLGDQSASRIG